MRRLILFLLALGLSLPSLVAIEQAKGGYFEKDLQLPRPIKGGSSSRDYTILCDSTGISVIKQGQTTEFRASEFSGKILHVFPSGSELCSATTVVEDKVLVVTFTPQGTYSYLHSIDLKSKKVELIIGYGDKFDTSTITRVGGQVTILNGKYYAYLRSASGFGGLHEISISNGTKTIVWIAGTVTEQTNESTAIVSDGSNIIYSTNDTKESAVVVRVWNPKPNPSTPRLKTFKTPQGTMGCPDLFPLPSITAHCMDSRGSFLYNVAENKSIRLNDIVLGNGYTSFPKSNGLTSFVYRNQAMASTTWDGIGIIDPVGQTPIRLATGNTYFIVLPMECSLLSTLSGSSKEILPLLFKSFSVEDSTIVRVSGCNLNFPNTRLDILEDGKILGQNEYTILERSDSSLVLKLNWSPSGEVRLKVRLTHPTGIVDSLNEIRHLFPITIVPPKITKVLPNWEGGAEGVEGVVSPGMIARVLGTDLSASLPPEVIVSNGLVSQLNGAEVLLDGVTPLHLYYAQPNQINVVFPKTTLPGDHFIVVRRYDQNGKFEAESEKFKLSVEKTLPAFAKCKVPNAEYEILCLQRPDGSLVMPDSPLQIGEVVTAIATGLGDTQTGEDGLKRLLAPVEVRLNNETSAEILFAGESPEFPGVYQISFRVPEVGTGVDANDAGLLGILFYIGDPSAEFLVNYIAQVAQ